MWNLALGTGECHLSLVGKELDVVEEVQRHPLDKVGLTRILERGRLHAMPGVAHGDRREGGCGLLNTSLALCLCVAVLVGGRPCAFESGIGS